MSKYMGHSPSKERNYGVWQTLKDHVEGVINRTEQHVRYLVPSIPQITTYARLAGLLHDLGKYRDDFQIHRLKWHPHEERHDPSFEEKPCPHSDAGAKFIEQRLRVRPLEKWPAAEREERQELSFVIASHHGALRDIVRVPQKRYQSFCETQPTSARLHEAGKLIRGSSVQRSMRPDTYCVQFPKTRNPTGF